MCMLNILNYPTMEYWKTVVAIFPSRQSVFPSEFLKLPHLSPQTSNNVSVLGRDKGYTVKYGLSPREFPRVQPEGTPEGSGDISSYTPTWVTIQSQLPSLENIFSYLLHELTIFSSICFVSLQYFPVLLVWGLRCSSFKNSLGNTLCLEGNIATAIFQYSIFR